MRSKKSKVYSRPVVLIKIVQGPNTPYLLENFSGFKKRNSIIPEEHGEGFVGRNGVSIGFYSAINAIKILKWLKMQKVKNANP